MVGGTALQRGPECLEIAPDNLRTDLEKMGPMNLGVEPGPETEAGKRPIFQPATWSSQSPVADFWMA